MDFVLEDLGAACDRCAGRCDWMLEEYGSVYCLYYHRAEDKLAIFMEELVRLRLPAGMSLARYVEHMSQKAALLSNLYGEYIGALCHDTANLCFQAYSDAFKDELRRLGWDPTL
jgi:hypothetical protein